LSFSYHILDNSLHYRAGLQHEPLYDRNLGRHNFRPALPQMARPSCLYLGLGLEPGPYLGLCRDPGL
jgi:hypothetical protein